jgi:predicted CxxxxCH...CXXCH cytochrome family protein
MSTRSRIGIINKDKTVTSIYCHFDGYPEGVGKTLKQHWMDTKKIKKLLKLGNLSILGKEIGKKQNFDSPSNTDWCLTYGRDRGGGNYKPLFERDRTV